MKPVKRRFKRDVIRTLDNRVYQRLETGAWIRISPTRPWRGKSERRQVIKSRRENREWFSKA